MPAVVGEGRVRPCHVEDAGGGGTERDGRRCGEVGGVLGDAEVDGGLFDDVGADVLGHLRVDGVDGLVGGHTDGDRAVADVVLVGGGVAGGSVRPLDHAPVGAVVDGVGGDAPAVLGPGAVRDRGGEDERFEGGADLVVAAGRVVDVLLGVVDAAVHGDDPAVRGVDGGAADADVAVGRALAARLRHDVVVDGFDEGVLLLLLQRGGDPVAAGGQRLVVDDLVGGEVVLDGLDDVAALSGEAGRSLHLVRHGELHGGAVGCAEPVLLDHAVEYVVPAGDGRRLVLGVDDDVVRAGGVEQGGEVRAFGGGDVADVLAVVRLGGGLDAVGVAAEVAGVEVALEDVVLAHLAVEFDRDEELFDLADDGLFLAQVVVLHELLGDGRTALSALAGEGVPAARNMALMSTARSE